MDSKNSKKPLYGILLIPDGMLKAGEKREEHPYQLVVGEYQKGGHKRGIQFISSPAIRKIIQTKKLMRGHAVGSITVMVDHEFKRVVTGWYYPVSHDHSFARMGVGDFADLLLEKEFAKRFPTYGTSGSMDINKRRTLQLRKRGRDPTILTPLPIAWKQTRAKVIANHRKNKPRRRG